EPARTKPEPKPEPARTKPEPKPEPAKPRTEAPVLPREPEKKPEKKPERKPEPARPSGTAGETPRRTPPPPPAATPSERPGTGQGQPSRVTTGRPEDSGDQAGRRGAPTGSAVGTTAFGSEIGGVDNPDFKFGYYLDQLLARIDQNWARPSLGDNIEATIVFRIHKDGSVSDLRVQESSGFAAFDLAAQRAVTNAAPFPPLPRAYRHDSLGVTLIVR
ncbi:MAG TPA: energy transducer TonB, partial [Thermoanaerobaculia bacterium]|nr:energy transducer TonB [Thermoanaerobaculia bacterium]